MTSAAAETYTGGEGDGSSLWVFEDRAGIPREFTGWYVDGVSTETQKSRQWTEMEVYRKITGEYVLRVLGCSVVYHANGSDCNTGEPVLGRDMEADLEPCRRCRPGNYRRQDMQDVLFDVEVEIPSLKVARTPAELIDAMKNSKDGQDGALSYPAYRLLRKLRVKDPAIARELSKSRPL